MGSCFSSSSSSSSSSSFSSSEIKEESGDHGNIAVCVEEDEGLSSPNDEKGRRVGSLYSQRGKKGVNQDAAILCKGYGTEDGVVCGVFDGHGRSGHTASMLVRDRLPSLLLGQLRALQQSSEDGESTESYDASSTSTEGSGPAAEKTTTLNEWERACLDAFDAMDQELMFKTELDFSYSGTTAVSVVKQGKDLIVANLGDSRAVMAAVSEEDGHLEAVQLTTDLKASVPQEAERIRQRNGRVFALKAEPHVQRIWLPDDDFPGLAMARTFGDFQLKNHGVISAPQVSHRRLTDRDLFAVLATDGVWDVLSNEEVVSIVWSSKSDEEASKTLVEAAGRAWKSKFPTAKMDDCTAACLFFQDKRKGNTFYNSQTHK